MGKETEVDPMDQLEKNIGSLIDRLGTLEKDSSEYKAGIRELQAKAGRQIKAESGQISTVGSQILSTFQENTDAFQKFARKETHNFGFEVKAAASDMSFVQSFPSAVVSASNLRPGIVPLPPRHLHIRDLCPVTQIDTGNYVYLKETSLDQSPGVVPEGSLKPQMDFNLSEVSVPCVTIAAILKITRQMLFNLPAMQTFLVSRLTEELLKIEDANILAGTGSPLMSGINNTGNFTAGTAASSIPIEEIVQSIGQLSALNRDTTGIVLHPTDYYNIVINKALSGTPVYTLPNVVTVTPDGQVRILGIPIVWSLAQTSGQFTLGNFETGVMLAVRDPIRVEFFAQDFTLASSNKIGVRIETTEAFAVFGSTFFIKKTF